MPEPALGELTVQAARARMLTGVRPLGAETLGLDQALGRVLGEAVLAVRDQPPFDVSAMDGYALRGAPGAGSYAVIGESAAGGPFCGDVMSGEAVRIFTGARVPDGCRVVVQERARRQGETVQFESGRDDSNFVRPRGGDFRSGELLLSPGDRLDPWRLALAAAAGRGAVRVALRPRVAVLSTGEEIVKAGGPAREAEIFDSAGFALRALIRTWGGDPVALDPVGDNPEAIAERVRGLVCDLVVTLGGASVGDHDLTKPALRRLGLTLAVETVRLRPGKPTWFGVLEDGRRVLGLPGNPASALVCAELFLRPLLSAWQGADPDLALAFAPLAEPLPAVGPREHWMRSELLQGPEGLSLRPFDDQDSSLVAVFARADALVCRPAGSAAAAAGERVAYRRLNRL